MKNFVESLKALPVILDYRVHDQITGTISHLPHIIASTLVNFVKTHDTKDEMMKNLAAGDLKISHVSLLHHRSCGRISV